jgi:hypothetical protein
MIWIGIAALVFALEHPSCDEVTTHAHINDDANRASVWCHWHYKD